LTPVFDEETSSWSYLAIFEWALSHSSGPAIRLESLVPVEEQDGYLVTLYDGAPTGSDLQERVFRTESTLQEIQLHPEKSKLWDKPFWRTGSPLICNWRAEKPAFCELESACIPTARNRIFWRCGFALLQALF
jgi:hypothetical protein